MLEGDIVCNCILPASLSMSSSVLQPEVSGSHGRLEAVEATPVPTPHVVPPWARCYRDLLQVVIAIQGGWWCVVD